MLPLAACAPPQGPTGHDATPNLIQAAEQGDLSTLNLLLNRQDPVDQRNQCHWTPLMKASLNGHIRIVMRLLASGAQPDAVDSGGYSALMLAASNNHPGIINLLALHGADINRFEPGMGWNALIWAAGKGHEDSVRVLLHRGADRQHRDKQGKSAADWARENGHLALTSLLLSVQ